MKTKTFNHACGLPQWFCAIISYPIRGIIITYVYIYIYYIVIQCSYKQLCMYIYICSYGIVSSLVFFGVHWVINVYIYSEIARIGIIYIYFIYIHMLLLFRILDMKL